MQRLFSYFHPKMPIYLVYMLQQVEYHPGDFFRWIRRLPDLRRVMYRRSLIRTPKALALIALGYFIILFYIAGAAYAAIYSVLSAIITLLLAPFLATLWLALIVLLVWLYYEEPKRRALYKKTSKLMKDHPALKIAIIGSYGKTSIKELLAQILMTSKNVAYTPANKNVMISHARWAGSLKGDEEVLIMEFGEGAPGDIIKMAEMLHPSIAIITGLAPNHLDRYKTIDRLANDLLAISSYVEPDNLFYNADDHELKQRIKLGIGYTDSSVAGWEIKDINVQIDGTSFALQKDSKRIQLHTKLLGRHNVGPIACAVALAVELGAPSEKIKQSIKNIEPYEHRMQPRSLNGAWLIDDTYNGNLTGMLAGLELLGELSAKRKIYVTPGLVDQGPETERVHTELGKAIAKAPPDQVVLMQNSVTKYIADAMKLHGYSGELRVVDDPLAYYQGLELTLAKGDLMLLQNDWTDNHQ